MAVVVVAGPFPSIHFAGGMGLVKHVTRGCAGLWPLVSVSHVFVS